MSLKASDGIFAVRGFNIMIALLLFNKACSRSFISLSNFCTVPLIIRDTVLLVVVSLRVTDNTNIAMIK